jgi:hypothetical protein
MMKKTLGRIVLGSTLVALLIACAKISTPSGGPRDKTPPVMIKSTPLKATKNFKGDKIEMSFNEYVVLDNIADKFMVSPPMKKKPRVFIRGKSVVVEFAEKLKDSTTYTFYFQDAIKDLNEGNIIPNFQFVFSTGPVIDSLSVTGNIYNANNLEVPEKTEVLMHKEMADSAVTKHLPQYMARVDQSGYFRIDNVSPGKYRLFGLKETDNSKNYNLPDEEFAFMDSTITISSDKNYIAPVKDTVKVKKEEIKIRKPVKTAPPDKNAVKKPGTAVAKKPGTVKDTTNIKKIVEPPPLIGEYRLFLFLAKKKAHYLLSSKREAKNKLTYVLTLPPDSMHFNFSIPDADSKAYFTEPSRNRDTLKVWLTDSALYSRPSIPTILNYPYTDSLGKLGYKQDTVTMRFTIRATKGVKKKKDTYAVENNISSGFLRPGQLIVFNAQTPFRLPDTSKIRLYEILQNGRTRLSYTMVKDSSRSTRYFMKTKLAQGKKYLFIADSASFSDVYKLSSDSVGIRFAIKDPDTYCKLTVSVKNYGGGRIIQLLDKSEKLVAETYMTKDGQIVFPLLDVGIYRLRVIYDLNGDKKWTTGDFSKHQQPEPVSYFPTDIELKAGWELEFVDAKAWDIGVKNFKDPKMLEKKRAK